MIDIEDSGIGIAEDQQDKIFQEFEQVSGQSNSKYGGTGLGLSISKRLITLMGGEFSLKSQPGNGSTFTIKLKEVAVASLATEPKQKQLENIANIQFHSGKILIADDIENNRDLLIAFFANTELEAVKAENGLEAVELAKQQQFDLILMDIRMPVMDGYQAAREINSFSSVPIVALTASVMTDDFERLKGESFSGYLRKPVLKTDLFDELSKFLSFERTTVSKSIKQIKPLTDSERESLPRALEMLEGLAERHHHAVSKTNRIADFKHFSDELLEIAKDHPLPTIIEYAEQLKNQIDSFEITSIKRSLNDYPQLIHQLTDIK